MLRSIGKQSGESVESVDTDVTIPVSPRSRYIEVYRRTNNYRETTQLHASIVSIADVVQLFPLVTFKTSKLSGEHLNMLVFLAKHLPLV